MPTASSSAAIACASKRRRKSPPLDPAPQAMEDITSNNRATRHPGRHQSERPADFDRKWWPTSIGMPGRHDRNPHAETSVFVIVTFMTGLVAVFPLVAL